MNHSLQTIVVNFKEEINIEWLQQLQGVNSVKHLTAYSFQLHSIHVEKVKKQLLQLSIDKNLNIISLQSADYSLEEIFKDLTNR